MTSICVCGAGTMGSGIAQVVAQNGFSVIQFDVNDKMLLKSKSSIESSLQKLLEKEKITAQQKEDTIERLIFTSNINDCVADLIIEAVIEKKEINDHRQQKIVLEPLLICRDSSERNRSL